MQPELSKMWSKQSFHSHICYQRIYTCSSCNHSDLNCMHIRSKNRHISEHIGKFSCTLVCSQMSKCSHCLSSNCSSCHSNNKSWRDSSNNPCCTLSLCKHLS